MQRFLAGAHAVDKHFTSSPAVRNLPVLLGLLGVWNSSFLGHGARALLPYSQALLRFPAHIQQVDMESNGKRVTVDGEPLPFEAGEIDFGEPGTNGQHSFYQLIHQGRTIPCDFIGFCESQEPIVLSELRARARSPPYRARRCTAWLLLVCVMRTRRWRCHVLAPPSVPSLQRARRSPTTTS